MGESGRYAQAKRRRTIIAVRSKPLVVTRWPPQGIHPKPKLMTSGLFDEITEQFKAKIDAIQYLKSDSADVERTVQAALAPVAGAKRIQRKVKHLRKDMLFAGYSESARKVLAPMHFTKRVTKVVGKKISRGNTRLGFYAPQLNSRLQSGTQTRNELYGP